MRTHTTLTLRNLIVNDMDVSNGLLSKQQISVWIQTLPEITGEMFETIYFFTHSIFLGKLIGRQIRQIHKECITLLDKIDKYQQLPPEMEALKSATIKCLDNVMEKLENDCCAYLDNEVNVPQIYLRRELVKIESQTQLIAARLKSKELPVKLQSLVLEGMNDIKKAVRCPYYKVQYIVQLQADLIELCKDTDKASLEYQLNNHLIRMNYNNSNYIKYYQQKLTAELSGCITEEEQMSYLYNLERDFSRDSYRKSAFSFDKKQKRVKHLLAEFVTSEISVRQKQRAAAAKAATVTAAYARTQMNAALQPPPPNYKISTAFTVDALAYFVKLLISAKVIEPGIRTELLCFIASIFRTPGVGSNGISPISLGAKYKQVVQSTATSVRAVLVRMLKILDEEFPPV